MAVKKAGELSSQQRCIFVIPWDVAGPQGLDPLESSEGLQTRAPPLATWYSPFSSPRTSLVDQIWRGCSKFCIMVT